MFKSAALKLTLWYLAIIMALSLIFSFLLYRISTAELERGLRRPPGGVINQLRTRSLVEQFRTAQLTRLGEGQRHLKQNLLLFNLATLLAGGAASYVLARRTLSPIEAAMEAQGRFTADASHELRTPLTAMKTEIEVALRDNKLNLVDAKQLLTSNLEEINKLEALSNALLILARSDQSSIEKKPVSLQSIAAEAVNRLKPVAKERGVKIVPEISDLTVVGDRASLLELIVILLDNAVKYSQTQSEIKLSAHGQSHFAYLSVTDQGQGIKNSDLPHIFDRFYRTDTSRSKEGYGLGLSIAQQIANVHGGSVEVHSTLDQGSTFTVKLPLAKAS